MPLFPHPVRVALAALLTIVVAACGAGVDAPSDASGRVLEDAADSLAARIANAAGGTAALEALSALRWDFAVLRDSAEVSRSHHLWDREAGRHRLEWITGDSVLVAVFATEGAVDRMPAEGAVYLNGSPVDTASAGPLLEEAYGRFINDMYWLLAPLKVFDPGARRGVALDSADASTEVLALWFEDVGLTPGDRYWMHADRESGRILSWTFHLQSGTRGSYSWTDERTTDTPAGPITLPTRKSRIGGGTVIFTPFEAGAVDATFADPRPLLEPLP